MNWIQERLLEAKEAGEIVTIVYGGGSQPGTKRHIVPVQVSATEIRAHEIATGARKVFKLDKITIVTEGSNADAVRAEWKQDIPPVEDPLTLEAAVTPHLEELKALGWTVELTPESCFLFHPPKVAKTGRVFKPKQGPVLERRDTDMIFTEAGAFEERPSATGVRFVTDERTFRHLGKATLRFMERARAEATSAQTSPR